MIDKKTNIKKILIKSINECYCVVLNKNFEQLDNIAKVLESGVKMIQAEFGDISAREFIIKARKIHQLCSIYNALFIVKNRADIAKILDSDGICLEDNELEIHQAKEILDCDKFFSRRIQNPQKFDLKELNQIDYIILDKNNLNALNRILGASNIKIIIEKR